MSDTSSSSITASNNKHWNLRVFTTLSSICAVTMGLIGPFFIVHVEKLSGGMKKFGTAFAIMVFLQSVSTYIAGHYSDKIGRKPFMIGAGYAGAIVLFFYTIITDTYQLYMLQAGLGIVNGISRPIETSFLGDLTTKEKRGKNVGKFYAIVGISSSIGLSAGGYMVDLYGINALFYLTSMILTLTTTGLFLMKE